MENGTKTPSFVQLMKYVSQTLISGKKNQKVSCKPLSSLSWYSHRLYNSGWGKYSGEPQQKAHKRNSDKTDTNKGRAQRRNGGYLELQYSKKATRISKDLVTAAHMSARRSSAPALTPMKDKRFLLDIRVPRPTHFTRHIFCTLSTRVPMPYRTTSANSIKSHSYLFISRLSPTLLSQIVQGAFGRISNRSQLIAFVNVYKYTLRRFQKPFSDPPYCFVFGTNHNG